MSEKNPELSEEQELALAEAEAARGEKPIAAIAKRGEDGQPTEVWWSCDFQCFGEQNALVMRAQLALLSFYSDVSDPKTARGFRRVTDAGGRTELTKLLQLIESALQLTNN